MPNVITDPNAQPLTADILLRCFLGVGLDLFVADVIAHPDKYDIWEDQ